MDTQDIVFETGLEEIVKNFKLEVISCKDCIPDVKIHMMDVNRPGLPMTGFYDYFDHNRIQILGKIEHIFMFKN